MAKRKVYSSEQIIMKLREAEVLLSLGNLYSLKEAQILIEMWRRQYNPVGPHSAL